MTYELMGNLSFAKRSSGSFATTLRPESQLRYKRCVAPAQDDEVCNCEAPTSPTEVCSKPSSRPVRTK